MLWQIMPVKSCQKEEHREDIGRCAVDALSMRCRCGAVSPQRGRLALLIRIHRRGDKWGNGALLAWFLNLARRDRER